MSGQSATVAAGSVLLLLALGLLSGLVPLVNAEAVLLAAVLQAHERWPALVIAIAVGQSGAKVLIYLGARDGRRILRTRWQSLGTHRTPSRWRGSVAATRLREAVRRWSPQADRAAELLRRPVPGSALIMASAVTGIPPLAATSAMAGAAHMRLSLFSANCLAGRLVRFTVLALPVARWTYLTS